jgi:hypothetical protein
MGPTVINKGAQFVHKCVGGSKLLIVLVAIGLAQQQSRVAECTVYDTDMNDDKVSRLQWVFHGLPARGQVHMTSAQLKVVLEGQLGLSIVNTPDIKTAVGGTAYGMFTTIGITRGLHLAIRDGINVDWAIGENDVISERITFTVFKERDKNYMQTGAKVHGMAKFSQQEMEKWVQQVMIHY